MAEKRPTLSFGASLALLVAWCGFIVLMSAKTGTESQSLSDCLLAEIARIAYPGFTALPEAEQLQLLARFSTPIRKLAHFTEYFILAALTLNLLCAKERASHANSTPRAGDSTLSTTGSTPQATERTLRTVDNTCAADSTPRTVTNTYAFLRKCAASLAFSVLFAAGDEFHQLFVSGRSGQPIDVLIDAAGALLFCLIALGVQNRTKTVREKGAKKGTLSS